MKKAAKIALLVSVNVFVFAILIFIMIYLAHRVLGIQDV